jgi:hypothetical protein
MYDREEFELAHKDWIDCMVGSSGMSSELDFSYEGYVDELYEDYCEGHAESQPNK